jgi:hypothetical protein
MGATWPPGWRSVVSPSVVLAPDDPPYVHYDNYIAEAFDNQKAWQRRTGGSARTRRACIAALPEKPPE